MLTVPAAALTRAAATPTVTVRAAAAACAAAACVAIVHAGDAPALPGRIEGVVRLVAPTMTAIQSGAYPSRQVARTGQPASQIKQVVVFLRDVPRYASLPAGRAQIVQRDEAFDPGVVAITRGSTVEFPNLDPYFHNVFSLSRGATFDLGRYPRGEKRVRTFTQPGLVKVYCHIHSHMSASIMVFDHPHFTVPGDDGFFQIEGVPAGRYRLSAWHDRIGESSKPIVVQAGRAAHAEFVLPVEDR